jgi:Xaa-Pro aminopeptidase
MPTPSPADWPARLQSVRDRLAAHGVAAFVVSSPINIRYLTGFDGSAGLLVVAASGTHLLIDGRYEEAVRDARTSGRMADVEVERIQGRYDVALAALLVRMARSRVGVESDHLTLSTFERWRQGVEGTTTLVPVPGLVESLRIIKDAAEVVVLRRAAGLLSDVASNLRPMLGSGRTERAVAAGITQALTRAGFSKPAFDTIVASGPNSAYPHAQPTDRRLRTGDLVVLDFGGILDGYCVDLSRAAAIGRIGEDGQRVYEAVRQAQDAGIAAIRAGVASADVDKAARDVLEAKGFGPHFVHGTGHGLGLEVHEAPRLSSTAGSEERLDIGMVMTVEPGVYIGGLGGVRLEDDVLVTEAGCEVLTTAPRDLLVV